MERSLGRVENRADRLRATLTRAFAVVGGALAVRGLVRTADAFQNVQNRLRIVTDGTEELRDVTAQLLDISNQTRLSFDSTAELYTRLALSAGELGRSQAELLAFTRRLNQAVTLSGASASEASAGLIQLSQGLASGTLRGDELNSVLEQLPVIGDVIARGLGVTRGELRKLGAQGQITANDIIDSFEKADRRLADQFGKTVPTLGQSFEVLSNNFGSFIGELDRSLGTLAGGGSALRILADAVGAARDALTGFEGTFAPIEAERGLSTLGQQLIDIPKEIERIQREALEISPPGENPFFDEAVADRVEELRNRLEALQVQARATQEAARESGEAFQAPEAAGPSPAEVAATARAEKERADTLAQVLQNLKDEIRLNQELAQGHLDVAEAMEVELDLRDRGVKLTDPERQALLVTVQRAQATRELAQAYDDLVGPQEAANRQIEAFLRIMEQQPELAGQAERAIRELQLSGLEASTDLGDGFTRAFLRMKLEAEDFASVAEAAVGSFADRATESLNTFLETGEGSFRDFADAVLQDLQRILVRALVVQAISAATGAAGITSLPGLANGGRVAAGEPVIVGEKRPELFVPDRSGTVHPDVGAAMSQQAPQVNVSAVVVQDESEVPNAIASGDADEAIMISLARNRDKVRQVIG